MGGVTHNEERMKRVLTTIPMKRIGQPVEVAKFIYDHQKNDPEKARAYFADKLAFTTGPIELDRERQRLLPAIVARQVAAVPLGPDMMYFTEQSPLDQVHRVVV